MFWFQNRQSSIITHDLHIIPLRKQLIRTATENNYSNLNDRLPSIILHNINHFAVLTSETDLRGSEDASNPPYFEPKMYSMN